MLFQYFTPAQHRTGQDRTGRDGEIEGVEGRSTEREGEPRETMGNKFVFSFSFQLAIVCIYQSQVVLVQWTPSAVDTEYRLHEIFAKLNFKRTILSI